MMLMVISFDEMKMFALIFNAIETDCLRLELPKIYLKYLSVEKKSKTKILNEYVLFKFYLCFYLLTLLKNHYVMNNKTSLISEILLCILYLKFNVALAVAPRH